jgi:hypothetical protein
VQDLRAYDSARRATQKIPRVEIEALQLDVARLSDALGHRRMMEKSHAIGIDDRSGASMPPCRATQASNGDTIRDFSRGRTRA